MQIKYIYIINREKHYRLFIWLQWKIKPLRLAFIIGCLFGRNLTNVLITLIALVESPASFKEEAEG